MRARSLLSLVAMLASAGSAHADSGGISVVAPWLLATPPSAKVAGGFLTITNTGALEDRLIAAATDVAGSVVIHEMKTVNGVMMMSEHHPGVTVKPNATVTLKPFAHHLMLMDLKRQLNAGDKVKVLLSFEKAGALDTEFTVEPIGSNGPAGRPASK